MVGWKGGGRRKAPLNTPLEMVIPTMLKLLKSVKTSFPCKNHHLIHSNFIQHMLYINSY